MVTIVGAYVEGRPMPFSSSSLMSVASVKWAGGSVSEPVKVEIYSIDGIKRSAVQNGLNVVVTTDADGNVAAKTVVVKK